MELSPAGLWQWIPRDGAGQSTVPDPHDPDARRAPTMLTTDLALQDDPVYEPIARRFLQHPEQLADAFGRAWFKLTHIDMGPIQRYLGPLVPEQRLLWQDPVPAVDHELIAAAGIAELKSRVLASDLTVRELVFVAWASASTYRDSDKRGGANGARIQLAPQRNWEANDPDTVAKVLAHLERIRRWFNAEHPESVSLADLIVLAGCAAVEHAAALAGHDVRVPFNPGRTDAGQEWTDVESFAALEPRADGFRNYYAEANRLPAEYQLVDRANLLTLSAPEMTALVGGLRALDANHRHSRLGVLTDRPGLLTNDFFTNLLDMDTEWVPNKPKRGLPGVFQGRDRHTAEPRWTAGRVDLVFGSHSELRAIAEVYAAEQEKLVHDFAAAWHKVMSLDRFDLT